VFSNLEKWCLLFITFFSDLVQSDGLVYSDHTYAARENADRKDKIMPGQKFIAACVQNMAGQNMVDSLDRAASLTMEALTGGANFVCLPEYFSCFSLENNALEVGPHQESDHPAISLFSGLARDSGAWILLGSLAVTAPSGRIYNRSVLLDSNGVMIKFTCSMSISKRRKLSRVCCH